MPFQPIKIPQNVQIEDRIIGPLTLRQIMITSLGCGLSYAMWAHVSKVYGYVGVPLSILLWTPGVLSAIFAFIKINDLSMTRLCLLAVERMMKPPVRLWTPRIGLSINIRTFRTAADENKNKWKEHIDPEAERKIDQLSSVLDGVVRPTAAEAKVASPAAAAIASDDAGAAPVDASRIQASSVDENAKGIDGIEVRPVVSMMTTSPRRTHG